MRSRPPGKDHTMENCECHAKKFGVDPEKAVGRH